VVAIGSDICVRRELREGDAAAIVALHDRVYRSEWERNEAFVDAVARNVDAYRAAGWPERAGAVWLVDGDGGRLAGSLGLSDEGGGIGHVRWFVFEAELRGLGLGRRLLGELLAAAHEARLERLELETFSALTTAARLYRDAGFRVISAVDRDDWGPTISYQHYRLDLRTI
jgi:ribosomal protein S18 acetylase RimI-like enzyme